MSNVGPVQDRPNSDTRNRPSLRNGKALRPGFVHSVLSFTRLEVPEVELFETVVTFDSSTDPLTAHDALAAVFGHKAGFGQFLFRADSAVPGRYWIQSVEPWNRWPETALSALEPKRVVVQLAEGLMYRFTLAVCAGKEYVDEHTKRVVPFESPSEVDAWFRQNAANFGVKPLLLNVSLQTMRFSHAGQTFKVPHAVIEGAFEVAAPDRLRRRILKGFGSHRKVGLGQLQMSG